MEETAKRHPIQVVARRTGMTADRLRAWEKRYGVVEPGRSDGGRRLYSDDDIELLRLLHRAILGGRSISRVAGMSQEQLSELVREDEEAEATRPLERQVQADVGGPDFFLEASLAAIEKLDARDLDHVLRRSVVNLSAPALIEGVAAPLLKEIGDRWSEGAFSPAHEHLATQVLRRVLDDVVEDIEASDGGPNLVVTTPAGHLHELGALLAAATAAALGWQVTYLGPNLPAKDIAQVVTGTETAAVALSLVYPAGDATVEEELRELRNLLPAGLPLLVGGCAVNSYRGVLHEVGAVSLTDIAELRQELAHIG